MNARLVALLAILASDGHLSAQTPQIRISTATATAWEQSANGTPPAAHYGHKAVWTGSEMIVWGGSTGTGGTAHSNTGGRFNPATNSWTAMTTIGAPAARSGHAIVWTGSEMIVWGGYNDSNGVMNTGGRYNPTTNTWTALSSSDAPAARYFPTAVWTGSEMIVWGGNNNGSSTYFRDGGRYNPTTNTWTALSSSDAPAARYLHTAVWTGSEMIVWGGNNNGIFFADGGRYNPTTNNWVTMTTSSAPVARASHSAVWTGGEMIVWGGEGSSSGFNSGGRYSPATDAWTATATSAAPAARHHHTAVWTGSEMIVWGGTPDGIISFNTGGRYNPLNNSWLTTINAGTPPERALHTAVWTGSEMIVWGGSTINGGSFSFFNDTWLLFYQQSVLHVTLFIDPIVPGNTYTVERSPDLSPSGWLPMNGASQFDVGTKRTVTDPTVTGSKTFYRVRITTP
ncbi:MAG: hypothetical protein QE570_06040 [Verrucomicrobiota bacterium]|nr:hypothetical protein [Verrucomicrobiota bacterium]